MGDISEMRGLVVIGSFIGLTVLLSALIPSQFFASTYEGRTIETPTYFEAIDLTSYASTLNYTFSDSDTSGQTVNYGVIYWIKDLTVGGHELSVRFIDFNNTPTAREDIYIYHFWWWWIFQTGSHQPDWINKNGVNYGGGIYLSELDGDYAGNTDDLRYTLQCDHFNINVFFGFNTTRWATPSDAYNHEELAILFGVEWSQVNTSINAWDLVAMILFFGLPDVHWVIDAIIHIPIWIAEAYLAFILILRAIGAIFGGGA